MYTYTHIYFNVWTCTNIYNIYYKHKHTLKLNLRLYVTEKAAKGRKKKGFGGTGLDCKNAFCSNVFATGNLFNRYGAYQLGFVCHEVHEEAGTPAS